MRHLPVAMTIAGSDPSGGAGMQADLKTFAAVRVYGLSVITAVIAQNSATVSWVQAVSPDLITAQLATIVAERVPDALKIGALASAGVANAVATSLESLALPAPVLDPVLVSSSGTRLLDSEGETILRARLMPHAALVTPNIPEAAVLSGIEIDGMAAMREAALTLHRLGPHSVLIKGGHWPTTHGGGKEASKAVDLFFDGRRYLEFTTSRIPGDGAHGTGCTLSAAIAAWLARGIELETAIRRAKSYVTRLLKNTVVIGKGRCMLDHFMPL
ncbi:MAG TPA: bifunctional hydroxymethylpyrimidine kinase/phosphomethylpyrimidine kinase [Candidatus Binataceae bacterium]|nr:bifunctional hydroxymethylpyrimidine kinase/phosphomethylpyrimidine kinase [Candidatus Binataceae bacterium]